MDFSKLNYPPDPISPNPQNNFFLGDLDSDLKGEKRVRLMELWEKWSDLYPDDPEGLAYCRKYQELEANLPVGEPPPFRDPAPTFAPELLEEFKKLKEEVNFLKEKERLRKKKPSVGGRPARKRKPGVYAMEKDRAIARFIWGSDLRDQFRKVCEDREVSMTAVTRQMAIDFINGTYKPILSDET